MLSKYCRLFVVFAALSAWILFQLCHLCSHSIHQYNADPRLFSHQFDLVPFYRTNYHSKGLRYWYDWLEHNGHYHSHSNTEFTLIYLDTHANDDTINDEIYECSPGQFFQYDQMVIETLELTESLIDNFIDLDITNNISENMHRIGYFSTVIWVYPDHWTNFSTIIPYDVHYKLYQEYARHQTYYITPSKQNKLQHQWTMLKSIKYPTDMYNFWFDILFKNSIYPVDSEMNLSTSVKIDIMAIPLSQILTEPHLLNKQHKIILDIDLDFFCCQNIAENLMERFEWDINVMNKLNTILTHHQYLPNHIPNTLYQQALITLLHILNKKETIPIPEQTKYENNSIISIPKIVDVIKLVSQNDSLLNIYDLKEALYFLYRLQLELGEEFMDSLELFLSTHNYLDQLLEDIDSDRRTHRRLTEEWHRDLATTLNMQHVSDKFQGVTEIDVDGNTKQMNENHFTQHILPYLNEIKRTFNPKKHNKIHDESLIEPEDILDVGILLLQHLKSTKHQHKISQKAIEDYLKETGQQLHEINFQNLSQFIVQKEIKIWNPDHNLFHEDIEKKRIKLNDLSYPQMLHIFDINPLYMYSEWVELIKEFKNETWSEKYEYRSNNDIDEDFTEEPLPKYNESKLQLTAKDIDDVIHWKKLDKIQQHFLEKGDHKALNKFIGELIPKQQIFLKWLLFCFIHLENCENGHNPFELVNDESLSKYIFGTKFDWSELIRIPSFVESSEPAYRGLLQLEFISLGTTQKWLPVGSNEQNHVPEKMYIKSNIRVLTKFLSANQNILIAGGIELSRAYVPIKYQIWIECLLMKHLHQSLYHNISNSKISFLRYHNFEPSAFDSKNTFIPKCANDITTPYI